jgi:general secretion pathway protein D
LALFLLALAFCLGADNDAVAARLAKQAERARKSGQLVRAYLLYAEAAARDPHRPIYALNRDGLAPLAKLLSTANIEKVSITEDVKQAEEGTDNPTPFDSLQDAELSDGPRLGDLPHLAPSTEVHSFDIRLDAKSAITQVAQAYGISAVFDPSFDSRPLGRFSMTNADFKTVMEGLTQVTNTFIFPLTPRSIFVAVDSEQKRNEYEPVVLVTVPLPNAVEAKDVVEAANAVRGALKLRFISWDSTAHLIIIRDHVTAARTAAALFQAIVLPRGQLSLEVQILAVDSSRSLHYGLALPTAFPTYAFAHLGNFQSTFPDISSATGGIFAFALGHSFFGVALGNATAFASYTKSISQVLFQATMVVDDGQTANLHVGDRYPIPTSIYTGGAQSGNAGAYNPIGQVTQEDLGIKLKVSPHITGSGEISLDLEADYKALSGATFNTVPAVAQRTFKGSVKLSADQYAIIAGLTDDESSTSKSGLPGLAQLPGIDQVLAENRRNESSSNTLLLIKPTITRLPMDDTISPQFLLGSTRGARVLL